VSVIIFFFQAEDGIRDWSVTGVQTCALPISPAHAHDTIDEKHPPVYKLPPVIPSIDFSPDGKLLAVAGFHEVLLHKADGSALVRSEERRVGKGWRARWRPRR